MRALVAVIVVAGAAAAVGCSHGPRSTVPTQPFRDETEPKDGFQYHESAVPSPGGEAADKSTDSSDSIEIEIDEESADGAGNATEDGAEADAEADQSDDGSDGSDEGDDEDDDSAEGGAS
jgi:hypothetical protein